MNYQIRIFLLWCGETFLAFLVSVDMKFDVNEFRVWSLWVMSILLGLMQIIGRETMKEKISLWVRATANIFKPKPKQ